MSNQTIPPYKELTNLAKKLRDDLEKEDFVLLYAFNGIGKTRLSMDFKNLGKNDGEQDTLYFNAFTEDLFTWDNDLDNDAERVLIMNKDSQFFSGLKGFEIENLIRRFLHRYVDFYFLIDYSEWTVNFFHKRQDEDKTKIINNIKISRGEENIFIWCFFLAVAQLVIDGQEAYNWVKCIYIDDPISSLDNNNAIAVACDLAQLLKDKDNEIKVVLSSHHTLFFNVMWNELKREKTKSYFLSRDKDSGEYTLHYAGATPSFYHVALLKDLYKAARKDKLYTYHFNMLRSILEKTASFHGFEKFSDCILKGKNDSDRMVYARMLNVLSHGNHSLFEPMEMQDENKEYFKEILNDFIRNYRFNPKLFK